MSPFVKALFRTYLQSLIAGCVEVFISVCEIFWVHSVRQNPRKMTFWKQHNIWESAVLFFPARITVTNLLLFCTEHSAIPVGQFSCAVISRWNLQLLLLLLLPLPNNNLASDFLLKKNKRNIENFIKYLCIISTSWGLIFVRYLKGVVLMKPSNVNFLLKSLQMVSFCISRRGNTRRKWWEGKGSILTCY